MQTTVKPYLLCVDDEIHNLDALERIFRKDYTVLKATHASEAYELLKNYKDIPVIISDQRMPDITGVELLSDSLATHPDSIRILLTGYTDIESVIEAVNKGQIYRYLTKPWDTNDLLSTVKNGLEKYNLKNEIKQKNEDLKKALDELKNLDQAKSQFMILINHELKTPLTSIMSFSSLLKETSLNEEQSLFVNRIIKSSEKLKNIVDDVMLIVKGEIGLIPVKKDYINPDSLITDLTDDIKNSLQLKNQKIDFKHNSGLIHTDIHILKTALFRALQNATKFGKAASTILISIDKESTQTIIAVENSGPAISDQLISKILKPFQLDENVMNHSVGMGLGLTICQTLMKSLKGQLHIKNNPDGVRVEFIIPD